MEEARIKVAKYTITSSDSDPEDSNEKLEQASTQRREKKRERVMEARAKVASFFTFVDTVQ
jgi:hypothetical protein